MNKTNYYDTRHPYLNLDLTCYLPVLDYKLMSIDITRSKHSKICPRPIQKRGWGQFRGWAYFPWDYGIFNLHLRPWLLPKLCSCHTCLMRKHSSLCPGEVKVDMTALSVKYDTVYCVSRVISSCVYNIVSIGTCSIMLFIRWQYWCWIRCVAWNITQPPYWVCGLPSWSLAPSVLVLVWGHHWWFACLGLSSDHCQDDSCKAVYKETHKCSTAFQQT